MIEFRMLGQIDLRSTEAGRGPADGTDPSTLLTQSKPTALLAYLLLHGPGGMHRRDELVGVFWPELNHRRARAALSQALYLIRKALGSEVLQARGVEDVGVADGMVSCDAVQFRQALAQGRPGEALALYGGDLLPGFFTSESHGFERWLDMERAELTRLASTAAWTLATKFEAAGNASAAGHWARRAARLTPYDERAVQRLMETLARLGDRGGALRAHQAFRERAVAELEIEPSAVTEELAERIAASPGGVTTPVEPVPPSLPSVSAPLAPFHRAPRQNRTPDESGGGTSSRRYGSVALVSVVVLLVAVALWVGREVTPGGDVSASVVLDPVETVHDRPRLAVRPFVDLSRDEERGYFSDGLTEELVSVLARIEDIRVVARASAFEYRASDFDVQSIGDSLDVKYVVEGSVRRAGSELRITARLIDTETGEHLWAHQFDRTLDDVFAVQTEIAEAIAGALQVPLRLGRRSELVSATDLETYDLYLAGRARVRERGHSLREAIRVLRAAVDRNPGWAPAWAVLAQAYELRGWYPDAWDNQPEDNEARIRGFLRLMDMSEAAAKRALALDSTLAAAHSALGGVYRNRREWELAEASYERALKLDPDDAEIRQQYAEMLWHAGRIAQSVAQAETAVRLDPMPIRMHQLSNSLWTADRLEEGLELMRDAIARDPFNHIPNLRLDWYIRCMQLHRFTEARRYGLPPAKFFTVSPAEHRSIVRALRARDPAFLPPGLESELELATWGTFGDPERAYTAAERHIEENPLGAIGVFWLPALDSIRMTPRFQSVMSRANLEGVEVSR